MGWFDFAGSWFGGSSVQEVPKAKEPALNVEAGGRTGRQMYTTLAAKPWDGLCGLGSAYPAGISPADSASSSLDEALAITNGRIPGTYANYRAMRADGIVAIGR